MIKEVSFSSEDCKLAANLHVPEVGEQKNPLVIMCHGFAGVKELLLPRFAEYFVSRGLAVLTFDYRGFGQSEGVKGRIHPFEQISDIRNAIVFARTLPEVDASRIGLWGSSYGGANAITSAVFDGKIKAVCAQITFADGQEVVQHGMDQEAVEAFEASLEKIWARAVTTGKQLMIPLVKMLTDPQSLAFVARYQEQFPDALQIRIPFVTIKDTMTHKPIVYLKSLNAALHLTMAQNDLVNPPIGMQKLYEHAKEPKELYVVEGAGHYDVYEVPHFSEVAKRQADWFLKYL